MLNIILRLQLCNFSLKANWTYLYSHINVKIKNLLNILKLKPETNKDHFEAGWKLLNLMK